MSSIEKRMTTSGEARYDVRYRLPSGQARTKSFRTMAGVTAWNRGGIDAAVGGRLTVTEKQLNCQRHRYDVRYQLASGEVRTRTFRGRAEAAAFAACLEQAAGRS